MTQNTILIFGILFLLTLAVPVSAEFKFQKTEYGKVLISNGPYWMNWDPVGDHIVGEKFPVNLTTNFPVGTELNIEYLYSDFLRTKIQGTTGKMIVELSNNGDWDNVSSTIINTGGLHEGRYFLIIQIVNSPNSSVATDFSNTLVFDSLELYSKEKGQNNQSPSATLKPNISEIPSSQSNITSSDHENFTNKSSISSTQKTPLKGLTIIVALLISLYVFSSVNKK